CWGDNENGQATPPDVVFTAIAAGYYHTCGLDEDGAAHCWGNYYHGLSDPPDDVLFTDIAAGHYHSCGIRAGDRIVVCWGAFARNLWQ
ncbi:MAG: hypothetical protein GX146_07335, partial [Myxococcales bacterium]|nr:hypothetical protein [Myxococcales bacterium]